MQQEAVDELLGRQGDVVQLLAAVVALAKSDLPIFKALQPRVTDGHAKDITGEIVEHLTTLARGFAMDHPVFFPQRSVTTVKALPRAIRTARARLSRASATPRKRRSKACASRVSTRISGSEI
jgi:hypothetical protein